MHKLTIAGATLSLVFTTGLALVVTTNAEESKQGVVVQGGRQQTQGT